MWLNINGMFINLDMVKLVRKEIGWDNEPKYIIYFNYTDHEHNREQFTFHGTCEPLDAYLRSHSI